MLKLISVFNQLSSLNFNIYCQENYIGFLENYTNEHIHFIKSGIQSEDGFFLEADIIITYGSGVIHFLKQKIPVLIIGPYGLGDWVTPENFFYLLKTGFMGRAGGILDEFIPVEIVAHEMLTIKDFKDLPSICKANKKLADKLPYKPLSSSPEIIAEYTALQKRMNDPQARWKLQPALASNVLFENNGETIIIKRRYIHDTLCSVSNEDMPFFQAINGTVNCKELNKISQMDEDDFWEMMYALNEKRIIIF